MAISRFSNPLAGIKTANDFSLLVGTSGHTTFSLDRVYSSGRYIVDFVNDDITYDIYFVSKTGAYVGHTNSSYVEVTDDFEHVVVIGAATNETILFTYQGPLTVPVVSGNLPGAGAFITGVSPSSLPNIDDETIVTGGNFAENVTVSFRGQNSTLYPAKSVTRTSSTQLSVARPDNFPIDQSPYDVIVENPGIPVPAATSAHILNNAITAGSSPTWVTGQSIYYNVGVATSAYSVVAEDVEDSEITYSLVAGTLPTGITLASDGEVSGTFTGSAQEGDVTNITIRATDAGGNYVDQNFLLLANASTTWTTAAGTLGPAPVGISVQFQLEANSGTAGGAITYSLVSGQLPAGLSLSSNGLISGQSTEGPGGDRTFTIRATDELGLFSDREFTINAHTPPTWVTAAGTVTSSTTFQATANTGATITSYTVVAGALPSGLTINSTTGAFSGAPSETGSFTFTVRATDSYSTSSDREFSLTATSNAVSTTFSFTGAQQTYTLPSGVSSLQFDLYGASGGRGGAGGRVTGTLSSISGGVLYIYVGGQGTEGATAPGGFNGGGATTGNRGNEGSGGGATDIRMSGTSLNNRVVVAGAGGGSGGYAGAPGGMGGGLIAEGGGSGQGGGGGGGTQTAGGSAGYSNGGSPATSGSFGIGGTGGFSWNAGGGGGGGGWYGGGGGGPDDNSCCSDGGGGGGGSSYARSDITSNVVHTQGVRTGDGEAILSYTGITF